MSIFIKRLETETGAIFENAEVAPDALQVLHIGEERVLEFFVTRKVESSRVIPNPIPGGPTEATDTYWLIVPGSKFQVPYDAARPLHEQAYDAVLADPRFHEA